MKRYRILSFDFDSRARSFDPIPDNWDEKVKEAHLKNRENTVLGLSSQYGERDLDHKVKNFADLGAKPISLAAFHNRFLEQIRNAYVVGSYYPALTGACALGERILNHMVLLLRDHHKGSQEYKKLYRKDSFDQWPVAIDALASWDELLPEAATKFRELNEMRNRAIHFNPETDHNDKDLALKAIHVLQDIVSAQFSAFGSQPWYFCIPGEMYVKKNWEEKPFVKHIVIPNGALVGPRHEITSAVPQFVINDRHEYPNAEITDEEFTALREKRLPK
ncbi:hypothetical protein [Massilia rhizosphaerae]|uniref:hypothetical protein n=1 Tax=Massilia rhizosphaerae TaxID=2784389 RepID=UPI0018DB26C0|nr:hypothetical protein [Massilia rhizosphaerae]